MDISKYFGLFGMDPADAQQLADNPQLQEMLDAPEVEAAMEQTMQNPALSALLGKVNGMFAQGGIMPDDIEGLMGQLGAADAPVDLSDMDAMFARMSEALGIEYDEIDLDEEVAAYDPAAEDAADRAFAAAMKTWIRETLNDIPADDVCMLEIGYHLGFTDETLETPVYDLWLAYNTEQTHAANCEKYGAEVWNWINWTDHYFRTFPAEPFAVWRKVQGYDEDNDGDEMTERIYDLVTVAVMELHREKCTEQRFGRKVPFVIGDYEYNQKTAIRAVKANGGRELFDKQFFYDCGFEDDEEEA